MLLVPFDIFFRGRGGQWRGGIAPFPDPCPLRRGYFLPILHRLVVFGVSVVLPRLQKFYKSHPKTDENILGLSSAGWLPRDRDKLLTLKNTVSQLHLANTDPHCSRTVSLRQLNFLYVYYRPISYVSFDGVMELRNGCKLDHVRPFTWCKDRVWPSKQKVCLPEALLICRI